MVGQDQVTFLVQNQTDGNLAGAVDVSQPGGINIIDPATAFIIPPLSQRVITYSGAVAAARLSFSSAGQQGFYRVSVATRDE
jgi:hypothetical protein